MDPWLRELANVNRERQDEERSQLDERWDRLSAGDLSPEEEAELRALAETSDEARDAYEAFRPLGPEFHAGVVGALREQGLVPAAEAQEEKPAKLLPFRGRAGTVAVWGSLAAAAVLLVVIQRPPAPLPDYSDPEVSGVSSFRSEQSETTVPVLVPGRPFEVMVRPEILASETRNLQAQAFLSRDQELRPLKVQNNFDPSGSVQIQAVIDPDARPGAGTLWVVVGRQGKTPDAGSLRRFLTRDRVRQRDWVAVSRKVQIQPGDPPP